MIILIISSWTCILRFIGGHVLDLNALTTKAGSWDEFRGACIGLPISWCPRSLAVLNYAPEPPVIKSEFVPRIFLSFLYYMLKPGVKIQVPLRSLHFCCCFALLVPHETPSSKYFFSMFLVRFYYLSCCI